MATPHIEMLTVRTSYLLALLSILVFLATLYQRHITGDDAWFAEQAYWFAKDGYVHSDIFAGVMGYDVRQFVYHKLHVWQGSLIIWLFGWNVYYLKALPILYIVIFLFLIRHYLNSSLHKNSNVFCIFIFLFFANNLIIQHGFEYRPDIMMMTVGFASFMLLRQGQDAGRTHLIFYSGIAAGITALFHLNGVVFAAAGGTILISKKRYKYLPHFTLGCLVGFFPYVTELANQNNLTTYIYQLTNNPAHGSNEFGPLSLVKKLLMEPKRYLHHIYEATYLFIFLLILYVNWRNLKHNKEISEVFKYFIVLSIFVAIIAPGNKTLYLLYTMPYLLLITVYYFNSIFLSHKFKKGLLLLVGLFLVSNIGHGFSIFQRRNSEIITTHANIMKKYEITKTDHIVAPITFIFNEIGNVKILGVLGYLLRRHFEHNWDPNSLWNPGSLKITPKIFFSEIHHLDLRFALLDFQFIGNLAFSPVKGQVYFGYRYNGSEGYLHIFEKI